MESLVEYGIKNILAIDDVFYTITMETKVSTLDDHTIDIFDSINDFNDEFNEFVQDNVDGSFADFFKQENVVGTDALRKINENQQESYRQLRGVRDLNFIECIPEIKVIEEALDNLKGIDEKTLIVLDRKLASHDEITGKKRLIDILEMLSKYLKNDGNFFLVMYSSEPLNFHSYEDTIEYLEKTLVLPKNTTNEVALHINFLSKGLHNEDSFIDALRKSQKANYVNAFDEIFQESIDALRERVWDLNHNESIFFYVYLVEGQHIDKIIFDIFRNKFKSSYMEYIGNNYEKLVNPLRNSIQKYEKNRIEKDSIAVDKAPIKYRFIKEVNSAIHGGNKISHPFISDDIAYGDIIEIDDSSYLVISQNCDITVRNNGERSLNSFQLVKVKEQKKKINAKWLVNYLKDYANLPNMKFNLNTEGQLFFNKVFYNSETGTELQIMGFEEKYLKQIEEAISAVNTKAKLNEIEFHDSDKIFAEISVYKLESSEVYTIPCFWIDALLVRRDDNGDNVITLDTIEKSKEVRLATKDRLKRDFTEMIEKLAILKPDALTAGFGSNLFNPLITVEPLFNEDSLIGFKMNNLSRTRKLNRHLTRSIHLELTNKQTREAVNESIPI